MQLIDPQVTFRLIAVLSWLMIALGVFKILIYVVGEMAPSAYQKLKSERVRKFMTGTGNRLLFGLGGFLTALLGFVFLFLGRILEGFFARGGY